MKKVNALVIMSVLTILAMTAAAWGQCGCNTVSREEAKAIALSAGCIWPEANARLYCSQEGTVLQLTHQGFRADILVTIDGRAETRSLQFPNSVIEHKVKKIGNYVQQIIDRPASDPTKLGRNLIN